MLVSAVESRVSDVNIWGVKCDKVVDFPKSSHIWRVNIQVGKNFYKTFTTVGRRSEAYKHVASP